MIDRSVKQLSSSSAGENSARRQIEWRKSAIDSRQSKALASFALIALTGVFLASVIFSLPYGYSNSYSSGQYFTICGFKNFTGLPCPGCGLTHSFRAMGNGDLAGAFGFNLLGPPLLFTFALVWARSASVLLNKDRPVLLFDRLAERFHLVRAFLLAFAVFGVARIIYVLIYYPQLARESPMLKLIGGLFR
jgi:hypothetical protein